MKITEAKNTYLIEVTDTFGGQANYCWVRRYQTEASSIKQAIRKLGKAYDIGWRFDHGDNMWARYTHKSGLKCCFVEWVDPEEVSSAKYEYEPI